MPDPMKLSVIVPAFDEEAYLALDARFHTSGCV